MEDNMKLACISILLAWVVLAGCVPVTRQAAVAAKGSEVMPFDIAMTTHIFEKLDSGGRQQVIADDPADAGQIALIRQHLAAEAAAFAQGNFHDPSMIHGDDMAGMHALMMGAKDIAIEYSDLPNGGQILYTAPTPALVDAIHSWFDAQLSDHGSDAQEHP